MISIRADNLMKKFGSVQALKGVGLEIEQGMIYGLLGSNGAGKTTFIRLLTAAIKPSSGSLSVLGLNPQKDKRALRGKIGYMPQAPALYDDLSPVENIDFFGRAHSIENLSKRVDEVIEFVGLTWRARDPVYKFSGGMKQRVSLACALVHKPQILLLDEPTTGIDPKQREMFWKHFRELAASGITLIVSTHQMDEALYCDRLGILHEGRLLADDSPQQLLWSGQTKLKIWRGGQVEERRLSNYPEQLPTELQRYGLDNTISRIEIDEDTLETVVLRMINEREAQSAEEVGNARHR
ncbi:MAG: ABC transporter ATP-binding protein [Chloroflexi bacterium]|nr:ABC transporter ATP-binding protein [Chloroflexota bacterium]